MTDVALPTRPHADAYTVDMHCHTFSTAVEQKISGHPQKLKELAERGNLIGCSSLIANGEMHSAIAGKLTDLPTRIADMDKLGIDLQVLSPSPTQYYYWADEALADELVALQNRQIADACLAHPTRFAGIGAISLQHPALAVKQLREVILHLGLSGVEISSDPTGKGLDDPALDIFWQEAEQLNALIFLHPLGTSLGERVNQYYLSNIIGQPLETTIALSQLIYSGVLDRFPDLHLCAAHGGGFLPYYIGRFDHGYGVRSESRLCLRPPSTYLSQLYYDTVVHRSDAITQLIAVAGIDRIVAGTDYPFDMGEYALHALIAAVPNLDDAGVRAILGGNALRLLGLEALMPSQQTPTRHSK